jgi:hypothetical protein
MSFRNHLRTGPEAAGDNDPAIVLHGLPDGSERFVHRLVDEAAGVHDNQVRILIGSDRLVSLRPKLSQDPLGVHKGFRTAKADEANPARSVVVQVPFLIEDRLS